MTLNETVDLLTVAAAFDQRTIGEGDAIAWHAAVGDLSFTDSRQAVIVHYREHRERVMPADVRHGVKAIRQARLDAAGPTEIPPELADRPIEAREWLQRTRDAIADGQEPPLAIGSAR